VGEHSTDHPFVESDEWTNDQSVDQPRRRRWPIVVTSLAVVIVAIVAALYVAASHYQPLAQNLDGGYGAQILTSKGVLATNKVATGAVSGVVWTEPSGVFHVEVAFSITNLQRFPVTIDKVSPPAIPSGSSNVHVYFDSTAKDEGFYGLKGGPAFTPTTLASGGQIELVIHWDEQCVPTSADSGEQTYTGLPVEYSFVSFRHTVNVPIQNLTIAPRATC
jgi:hypothetical protein